MNMYEQKAYNAPLVYRGAYQYMYGPKTQVLRAIGPSPQEKRPANVYNYRSHYKCIVAKPYLPVQKFSGSYVHEEDMLDRDIKETVERIQDKTIMQNELNGMQPVTLYHRKECKSARTCNQLDRQELDLLRYNSLRGRRSTRGGREEPDYGWRDSEDFIPGESIDWIFKQY